MAELRSINIRVTMNGEPVPARWRKWLLMRIARLLRVPLRVQVD